MQRNDDETITPPALQGEHGLLQRWASARMDGLENKFDTQLTRVHDIMAKQADRLAKIEGGEEARREWRDDVRRSLEQIQRAMVAIPAAAATEPMPKQAGLVNEKNLPFLFAGVLVLSVLALVWAILFGDESIDQHLKTIRDQSKPEAPRSQTAQPRASIRVWP